jgi:twitching motility protein PilT
VCTIGFDLRLIRLPEPIIAAAESSNGLLIVTGPPGSGKTTTCYCILDHLNATRPIHIVTIGYHIEYVLEPKQALIQERQIGVDVPDMLTGIQSAVLQGADVIFVAEVRDLEVFNACLRVAEMDCLVVVQLHLPTPQSAIERMIALQPEEARASVQRSLVGGLRGVLAQCLLPTPDGRQVPAYGALLPDANVRQRILEGGHSLDELCSPRLEADIQALRESGTAMPDAAEKALRRLQA